MEDLESERKFDEINQNFTQFIELDKKPRNEEFEQKWKNAYKDLREKIIIDLYKLYVPILKSSDESRNTPKKYIDKNKDYYSEIIFEESIRALSEYETSGSKEKGCTFSQYVCMKINQKAGAAKSQAIISSNLGGSEVSSYEASMVRKILKQDKLLKEKLFVEDENKRNKKIAAALNISIELVEQYKKISSVQTVPAETVSKNGDGEYFSIIDLEENLSPKNYVNYLEKEEKTEEINTLNIILKKMDEILLKKEDPFLSRLITLILLKPFEKERSETLKNGLSLEKFYPEVYKHLAVNKNFNKEMLDGFFKDSRYVLPSQKELSEAEHVSKSDASQKIIRFRKELAGK